MKASKALRKPSQNSSITKINEWPILEQPRYKLFKFGPRLLSDAELIAIIIQTGTRGKTALDLARELLQQSGNLSRVSQALLGKLQAITGLGEAKQAMLKAAFELGKRALAEDIAIGEKINNSQAVKQFLLAKLHNLDHETFNCIFLNIHNIVLGFEELFRGTLTETAVYPREVVKRALAHQASKVILAHNHPSGNPEPSPADHELTQLLKKSLALIEVQVIDHIIIGQKECFSFAEAGWI